VQQIEHARLDLRRLAGAPKLVKLRVELPLAEAVAHDGAPARLGDFSNIPQHILKPSSSMHRGGGLFQ